MSQSLTVGFVGFGEAASCFAEAFARSSDVAVRAFCDGGRNHPPYTEAFRARVEATGTDLVDTLDEVVSGSDVVISAVQVASAQQVGEAIAERVEPGQLVVDINATVPEVKQHLAAAVEARGGSFVDANLMGAITIYGHQVQLYSSGSGAERFRELAAPYGFNVDVAGPQAGTSALVKMLRSVVTKGIEGLIVEAMTTAEYAGITEEAFHGICDPMDETKFSYFAEMVLKTNVPHAGRRAVEMEAIVGSLQRMGIEPTMTRATTQRLKDSTALGLRERFGDTPPADYREVLRAYREVERPD